MPDAESHAKEAVELTRQAQEAIEKSRTAQIAEAIEVGIKPLREEQVRQNEVLEEHRRGIQETIGKLATKEDLDKRFNTIEDFINNVDMTLTITRGIGRYGKTIILTVATLVAAIAVITGGFKAVLAAVAGWALNK